MFRRRIKTLLFWFICLNLTIVAFQNCSPMHSVVIENSLGSGGYSIEDLSSKFSNTLQPVLLTNCNACHGNMQVPLFAVEDPLSAVKTISNYGLANLDHPESSKFIVKIRSGHNGFTEALAQEVLIGIQDWAQAMEAVVIPPPEDNEAPVVMLTAPEDQSNVTGTITVSASASASDNMGVVGVRFLVNGTPYGDEDFSAPYSVVLNTSLLANGVHELTAVARDGSGNSTVSAPRSIHVNNDVNDTTPPTVVITAPTAGAVLSGTINITANASDNIGVIGVQFFLNGAPLGSEDTSAPYSVSWNTTTAAVGSHSLTARARDAAGNTTTSAAISVTVTSMTNPNATYSWIFQNILNPRCVACHGSNRAEGGIRYNTYANTLGTVSPGNPENSGLYRETNSGNMPEGGNRLTAIQLQAIYDWISAGALDN